MAETVALHIGGMTCMSCVGHVKGALENTRGVRSAAVSYPEGRAELVTESGTSVETLTAAVAALGYRAAPADVPVPGKGGGHDGSGGNEAGLHVAVIGSGGAAMAAALK